MKKKSNVRGSDGTALRKICTIMKLCMFLLLFTMLSASARSLAQETRVSMEKKSISLLTVLKELGEKTDYEFFYNDDEVMRWKVSVSAKEATVTEILDRVLRSTSLTYSIVDNIIVISPKPEEKAKRWRISGTVKDDKGEPMVGVTVFLKGTTIGTATDPAGKFNLNFLKKDSVTVVFSFIGMKTQERLIKDTLVTDMMVTMVPEVDELHEVVVTGFGNKSKNSYTGSATSISREQLMSAGSKNLLTSLAAFVPGMQVVANNERGSDPNTRPEILIRGRSSFEGSSNVPTFIVDGAEVNLDYVFDMDINDVENVTVLKDASASALYGAKASKGVVVITTKPLKEGKMRVSYSGTFRASIPDLSDYHLLNAAEKLEYERRARLYIDTEKEQYKLDELYNEKFQRVKEGVNTDWKSKPLRNAFTQNHNISIAGGDEYVRYSMTARYGSDQGVMKESKRDRYSFGFKLSYNKQDKVYVSNIMTITSVNNVESPYGSFSQWTALNPYDRAYLPDGSINLDLSYIDPNAPIPLHEVSLGSYNKGEQFYLNNVLDIKIELLKDFRIEGQLSLNKSKNDTEVFVSPLSNRFKGKSASESGSIEISNTKSMDYSGRLMLSYNKMFGPGTLLSLLAGGTIQSTESNSNGYRGIGIFSDKLAHPAFATKYPEGEAPSGSQDISRTMGVFMNANMIYDDRYFLDASIRYEGNSKFGSEQRYAPFWSVGAGWNIHKEKFMQSLRAERLKLRGSIGYTGNASFSPYQAMTTYKYDSQLDYGEGIGAVPMAIGNPDLKWERTLTYNAGLDVVFFSRRLDMSVDYYYKLTDDLLLDVAKAPSVGTITAKENLGKIANTGIEVQARVEVLRNKNWNWALSVTMQHNRNKIKKISNALNVMNDSLNAKKTVMPPPVYEEGQSTSAVKAVKSGGIDPATGMEIYIDKQGNPTFVYDYWDKRVYGDSDPDVSGTFNSYLNWKGVSLNMLFQYSLGATIYNRTLVTRVEGANPKKNADRRVLESRWSKVGDRVKYKDIADASIPEITSRFIRDEYYLNMSSLSVAYDFTSRFCSKLYLSRLRVEFLMNDLFRISTIKQERGLDYPFARSFEFSISAAF